MSNLRRLPLLHRVGRRAARRGSLEFHGQERRSLAAAERARPQRQRRIDGAVLHRVLQCQLGESGPRDLLEHHRSVARGHDRRRLEPRADTYVRRSDTAAPYQQYGFDPSAGIARRLLRRRRPGERWRRGGRRGRPRTTPVKRRASRRGHELVRRGLRHHRRLQRRSSASTTRPRRRRSSTSRRSPPPATSPRRSSRATRSAPHSQAEINLGTAIVDLQNVGVHVRVLRGALDIVGLQQSGPTVSFNHRRERSRRPRRSSRW